MSKSITGIAILLVTLLMVPEHQEEPEHDHRTKEISFANGVKHYEMTVCGDSSKVRFNGDGAHLPLDDEEMQLLGIEKPE